MAKQTDRNHIWFDDDGGGPYEHDCSRGHRFVREWARTKRLRGSISIETADALLELADDMEAT